jgi:hypothetical protein
MVEAATAPRAHLLVAATTAARHGATCSAWPPPAPRDRAPAALGRQAAPASRSRQPLRPLQPGDIAVLVNSGREAEPMRQALRGAACAASTCPTRIGVPERRRRRAAALLQPAPSPTTTACCARRWHCACWR